MDIGEIIKKYRKEKRMSQEMLARQTGISTMSIRRYESGERDIRTDELKKISRVLNIPSSVLFNFEQSEKDTLIAYIADKMRLFSDEQLLIFLNYIDFLIEKK